MQHPNETRRDKCITLPPIRDIFKDELSRPLQDFLLCGHRATNDRPQLTPPALKAASHERLSPFDPAFRGRQNGKLRTVHGCDLSQDFWHCEGADRGRELRYDVDNEPPDGICTLQRSYGATDCFPRRASDGMQYVYSPMHYGRLECTPRHSCDACPCSTKRIYSRLMIDEGEQVLNRHQPPSRPSSSEGSTSGKSTAAKYGCPYCGKGFSRPSSLKIHINSHTGEKPFICPVESCRRSFSVLSNMRRHARMHTQDSVNGP